MSTDVAQQAAELFDRYDYPDWLRTHSTLVGRIAHVLAEARRLAGDDLEIDAVALAGYLHDIGRSPLFAADGREHNELSALAVAAEGLPQLAEMVRRHPVYVVRDPERAPRTMAEKIVHVADRRGGLELMSIADRIEEQARRFPEHAADILAALEPTLALEREVFAGLPFTPDELEAHL